jgi:hypothetical protein
LLGDSTRKGSTDPLHGEHSGGMQPKGVSAQFVRCQGHQALLEQESC